MSDMTAVEWTGDHPAKLPQDEDEDYVAYLARQADAWCSNPPLAPDGFRLIPCNAASRHWPKYEPIDSDYYETECDQCAYASLYDAHAGCAHSHHRRWRRWRITGKLATFLYVTGITSSGASWRMGGGCQGCYTMPKWNRNPRVYVLWVSRDTWRCLLKGHHRPGDPIGFGYCSKCLPCPECGSKTAGHARACPDGAHA